MESLEGDSVEEEIKTEKIFELKENNIAYDLTITYGSENIEFKINNKNNNFELYFHYKKYSLKQIIDIFKLNSNSYNNFSKIFSLIKKVYSENKISIASNYYDNDLKLIFILSNERQNEYKSILLLNKQTAKIEQKFEFIINEIKQMKNEQNDYIKNKFDEIETEIKNIKNYFEEKNNEKLKIIDDLNKKINDNGKKLKENISIIQKLKNEIKDLNELLINCKKLIIKNSKLIKGNKDSKQGKKDEKNNNIKIKENKKDCKPKNEEKSAQFEKKEINNNKKEENNIKQKLENKNGKKEEKINLIIENKKDSKIERIFETEEKIASFYSIMIIGDNQVGKSWVFDSFFSIPFTDSPSICLDQEQALIKINDEILSLTIEDCPGKELFFKINIFSMANKDMIIFIYSIDNRQSFETICKRIKEAKSNFKDTIYYILVGNKLDLSGNRVVSEEEGKEIVKKENLDCFLEVSAKTGENIELLFFEAAKILYKKNS